jgi:hypothetical protein
MIFTSNHGDRLIGEECEVLVCRILVDVGVLSQMTHDGAVKTRTTNEREEG